MARKTLLTEAQVRQFMKLAHMPSIGSGRLQEMGYNLSEEFPVEDEEEEVDDMGPETPMDPGAEMAPDDDLAPEMDVAPEDDMEMGDSVPVDKEDQFSDLVQQLADLVGIEVDLTTGDDLGAEMAPEDGLEVDADDGLGMAPDGLAMDSEEEEEDMMPMQERTQDALVKEVARRVAKRIGAAQKKDAMVDQLAERILKRLTK